MLPTGGGGTDDNNNSSHQTETSQHPQQTDGSGNIRIIL
jgi:hypothetical protein